MIELEDSESPHAPCGCSLNCTSRSAVEGHARCLVTGKMSFLFLKPFPKLTEIHYSSAIYSGWFENKRRGGTRNVHDKTIWISWLEHDTEGAQLQQCSSQYMMIGGFHHRFLLAEISGTTRRQGFTIDGGTQHWIDRYKIVLYYGPLISITSRGRARIWTSGRLFGDARQFVTSVTCNFPLPPILNPEW
jgi:hypothetical protein